MSLLSKSKAAFGGKGPTELRETRRWFEREHRRFKDRALQAVDETIALAIAKRDGNLDQLGSVQTTVDVSPGNNATVDSAVFFDGLSRLGEAWRAAIERQPAGTFSSLSFAEFSTKLAAVDEAISKAELAGQRTALENEIAQRQAELDVLDREPVL